MYFIYFTSRAPRILTDSTTSAESLLSARGPITVRTYPYQQRTAGEFAFIDDPLTTFIRAEDIAYIRVVEPKQVSSFVETSSENPA